MQGKPVHIDNKFTDRAWGEMSILLDQEMPLLPKKRRKVFGWWWFGLLAIGMLSGAVYFVLGKKTEAKLPDNMPVASAKSVPAESHSLADGADKKVDEAASILNEDVAMEHEPAKKTTALNSVAKKSSKKTQVRNVEVFAENNAQHAIKTSTKINVADDKVLANSEQKLNAIVIPEKRNVDADYLGIAALKPIIISNDDTLSVVVSLAKNQWNWAIEANALAIPNLNGGGFALEAMAIKPLKNKRFNISVGAGYVLLAQPIYAYKIPQSSSVALDGLFNGVLYENADKAADAVFDPNISGSINNLSLKLHYLNIPIQLSYRITQRLSLKVGATNRILLASNSNYTNGGVLGEFAGAKRYDEQSGSYNAKISVYDFAIDGGVGISCTPKMSLQIDYIHGLTDVLPGNNVGDFNRLLKFGIRYNLSGRH